MFTSQAPVPTPTKDRTHALLACLPATRGAFARYTRDCEATQRPISTSFNRRQLPAAPVTASDVFAVASSLVFVLVDSRGRTRSASGRDQREIGARVRAWVRAIVTGLSRRSTYFALCLFFFLLFSFPRFGPSFLPLCLSLPRDSTPLSSVRVRGPSDPSRAVSSYSCCPCVVLPLRNNNRSPRWNWLSIPSRTRLLEQEEGNITQWRCRTHASLRARTIQYIQTSTRLVAF